MLALSVAYRTAEASTTLAPPLKSQVAELRKLAMIASQASRHGDAIRHLSHGLSLMRGVAWTPAVELAASVVLRADRCVWEPAQRVRLRLEPRFEPSGDVKALRASARLHAPGSARYIELDQWANAGPRWTAAITVPEIAPGPYRLELRFAGTGAPEPAITKSIPVLVKFGVRAHARSIRNRLARIAGTEGPAFWTAAYAPELFDKADRGDLDTTRIDFDKELEFAEEIVRGLESGSDPLLARTGDMRRAYRSEIDGTLQPYRLYVPRSYDRSRAYPLAVALHGMGGDENSLFDGYGDGALMREAERNGFLVVCPKGREPASMYRGPAERDVLDVLAQVRLAYRVDNARIYMLGHSMGGYGTWSIAMNHPAVFAAIAPVAGGGNPSQVGRIRHIPQLVIHGEADKTVPAAASRSMVEAAKRVGATVKYLEVPGGTHTDVFVPALPEMFSWFNTHRKGAAPLDGAAR